MLRTTIVIASCTVALGAQVTLTHLGTVDVSSTSVATNPEYIGVNPSAVAWDGTDLFVAGFNNAASSGTTAIVKVSNALTAPTYGTPFGVYAATPGSRGYSGLDITTGQLAAALDTGASIPEGLTTWDLNGTPMWSKDIRGGSGVAFDPGFFGAVDWGTAWTTFSSGRRSLQDNQTGADIYTPSTGMIINAGTGTLWRDMDFDPFTGDIWLRRSNELVFAERVGGNVLTNNTVLVMPTRADFVNMQNLAVVRQQHERVIFWNDRAMASNGQSFDLVVHCTRTSDAADLVIDYGTFTAATGSGAYDFSYDDASQTLAISDFSNRKVYIFAVTLFHEYGTGCQGAGGITPALTASGFGGSGGALTYDVTGVAPSSIGTFAFGNYQDNTPLPFPGACPQHVTPLVFTAGLFFTAAGNPGSGTGTFTLNLGSGFAGIPITAQAVILESFSLATLRTSNGVETVLY
ncbi:MAG: hypothetical protein KDC98_04395 [Planctomycetes bacterium]|nr:hypothetical protein [Planctomycetota bacterium]